MGSAKGWVQHLPATPRRVWGRRGSSCCLCQTSWAMGCSPTRALLPWHRPDCVNCPGWRQREVSPELINTPPVNLLCLCYCYQKLMFHLSTWTFWDGDWKEEKQQQQKKNIKNLDCHCILIPANLQIQARMWEQNETPIRHLGLNDNSGYISNTCHVPTCKVTFWSSLSLQGPSFAEKVANYKSLWCICNGHLIEVTRVKRLWLDKLWRVHTKSHFLHVSSTANNDITMAYRFSLNHHQIKIFVPKMMTGTKISNR